MPRNNRFEYLDHDGILAFAHRGGALEFAENTMEGFQGAIDLGYRYIETDVHATRDGVLLSFHDDRLDRVTDGQGIIAEMDYADVKAAKIDGRYPIPLFDDLLTSFPDTRINIDPKRDNAVEPLIQSLKAHKAVNRVGVGSFSQARIDEVKDALGPDLCTSPAHLGVARARFRSWFLPIPMPNVGCYQVPPTAGPLPVVDKRFCDRAHKYGQQVHVWTIDDSAVMHQLINAGSRPLVTRVLHIYGGNEFGGAETYTTDVICGLAERGVEQLVLTRPWPDRLAQLDKAGVDHQSGPFAFPNGRWNAGWVIKRAIKQFQPDIIHSWMARASGMVPKTDIPTIGQMAGYYKLKRYQAADHIVGVSHDVRDYLLKEGVPEDRAHTIHVFAAVDDSPALDRSSLDTPDGTPLILFLGRLHWMKGIETLLDAFAKLDGGPYLWIAGVGELEADLKARCTKLGLDGRVRWLGWRQDRSALLRTADLCVMPSRYESFGAVMAEAWACDTPLVACRAQGPSAYIQDGQNGLLVDIDDTGGLTQAMTNVLNDPNLAGQLRAGGRATYEAGFTKARILDDWQALYDRLLADPKAAKWQR
ncbi:lpsE [Symbiodinium microadriaticum]|nr:lpsE [Symbiodinium microadriaticum]